MVVEGGERGGGVGGWGRGGGGWGTRWLGEEAPQVEPHFKAQRGPEGLEATLQPAGSSSGPPVLCYGCGKLAD